VLNSVRRLVSVSASLRRDESEGRAPREPNSVKMGRRVTPPSDSFTTADADAFIRELEELHPDNSDKSRAGSDSHREQAATSATTP